MREGELFKKEKVYLIDIMGFVFRAYHAIPHLSTSKGFPTNAIFGVSNMLIKLRKEMGINYGAVVCDSDKPTWRAKMYESYKAQRPPLHPDLHAQLPWIEKLITAMGFPTIMVEGEEADDVIASLAKFFSEKGHEVIIISGDKDLLSIVNRSIYMLDTMRDKLYTPEEVEKKFGVPPSKIADFLALVGDKIDNIPGVPGIGEKTASKLLREFESLDGILSNLSRLPPSLAKKIEENSHTLKISRELVRLKTDIPVNFTLNDLKLKEKDGPALSKIFRTLEFQKLLLEVTDSRLVNYENYRLITKKKELEELVEILKGSRAFSIDLETTSLDPHEAKIVGISLSTGRGKGWYIPVLHRDVQTEWSNISEVLEPLREVLESELYLKYGQNLKYDYSVLLANKVNMKGIGGDSMIAAWLLNPLRKRNDLDNLSAEYLGHQMISYRDVTGDKNIPFNEVEIEVAKKYSCEDAEVSYLLCEMLEKEMEKENLLELYRKIELPLIEVLSHMEMKGVLLDREKLEKLGRYFNSEIEMLKGEIFKYAGEEFNVDSPKQLQEILFNKLKLKKGKRTKTGYSTDSEVLLKLYDEHPIIPLILRHRTLSKLKSTYVEGLLEMINKRTGRVHTSFNQTGTATGRLSSSNPNLQNIPVRDEEGKLIREAFIAPEGHYLISGDYSQVELRILAHLSGDENLIELFRRGEDIHSSTARRIFGVSKEEVTPEMRRKAKVINFGIIYGMSPHGLSQELHVSHSEAKNYIDSYFSTFRKVKNFIDKTVEEAEKNLVVRTMFNRLRPVPELRSPDKDVRSFGERIAINTPIQGSAADIIKIAMINIHRKLRERGMKTSLIIQVHDELVLESPEEEVEEAMRLLKEEMEGAVSLSVPLLAEVKSGKNWNEAHS